MELIPLSEVFIPPLPATTRKVLLTVNETCATLSIKRTLLYEFLSSGELRSVKVRGRRLIPAKALDEFIEHLTTAQKAG